MRNDRDDVMYGDFMTVAERIACTYEVVTISDGPLTGFSRGVGLTFAAMVEAGITPTREQAARMLQYLERKGVERGLRYDEPEEEGLGGSIGHSIDNFKEGDKP